MNLAYLTESTYIGGAERQMLSLFTHMTARGHIVRVWCGGTAFAGQCRSAGLPAELLPPLRTLRGTIAAAAAVRRGLLHAGAGLVHSGGIRTSLVAAMARRAICPRPGFVMTVHNLVRPRPWSYPAAATLLRLCGGYLTTVAESERRRYLRAGFPPQRCRTVHNGVPLPAPTTVAARRDSRRALGMPEDALVVAQIGRLHPVKGHESLFRAIATLAPPERLRVLIVGDGPLRDALERRRDELGLGSFVTFTGFLDDVTGVLRAADLVVQPSSTEAFPMAILEAMACGVPVVATAVGGIPEMVLDGVEGWLVRPGDFGGLVAALRSALQDEGRRAACGAEARRRVEREFTVGLMVERTLAVYDEVLRNGLGRDAA